MWWSLIAVTTGLPLVFAKFWYAGGWHDYALGAGILFMFFWAWLYDRLTAPVPSALPPQGQRLLPDLRSKDGALPLLTFERPEDRHDRDEPRR